MRDCETFRKEKGAAPLRSTSSTSSARPTSSENPENLANPAAPLCELLAPAGSMESLKAAIANGCDAVYLGMQKFGARAYSSNFDEASLREAVDYAHLRNVKVYVTVNTIVFENELADAKRQLHFLNEIGVDGVIAQDLAILSYVAQTFEDMEAHCSTQMGIDDLEGTLLCKELGSHRVVLAREVSIETALSIKQQANLPIELFVHGALCISYSGNCIMSGMTGNRSGNRGRCIGSCRKLYDIIDVSTGEAIGRNYILSTKDLNTIEHIDQLKEVDSLKIEGRMKEPPYVANVVSRYRLALDEAATPDDKEKLNRTFNRTYTKGYLFHEDKQDITNVEKPNHFGYPIGTVSGFRKGLCEITLTSELRQNDLIRIRHKNEDINLSAAKIFDREGRLVNRASSVCYLKLKERLSTGDVVYKTKDVLYEKELENRLEGEYRRFPLDMTVHARPGASLVVEAVGLGERYTHESAETLSEAINQPTTKEAVLKQLSRLNDTVFCLGVVEYEDRNAFVPAKLLNAARKDIVEHLYAQKIARKPRRFRRPEPVSGTPMSSASASSAPAPNALASSPATSDTAALRNPAKPSLCASVTTQEQYDACVACGVDTIYFDNIVSRNNAVYRNIEGDVLVGGLGGIYHYRTSNAFITDYSLNVVNSETAHELHRLGAKSVTLSYEINERQIQELVAAYRAHYGTSPHLEMIVYGHAPLLVTKYCPLKKMGQCGTCRTHRYELKDDRSTFPLINHKNCDTTVLNGKTLNLLDEIPALEGIEAFRLHFTTESASEVAAVVAMAKGKLEGSLSASVFNPKTDTRGYFNKEIL